MITYLELDILKCEVKWALESITMNKASGGDGIPVELFQILKDDALKVLYSICQNLENSTVVTGLEKVSFHSNPKKGNARECSNYHTIALISHASKLMLKIFKSGFNSMWTVNFQMFKLVLEKAEEPEIKSQHLLDHQKSERVPEKHLLLLY